jgi:hypothetical protein
MAQAVLSGFLHVAVNAHSRTSAMSRICSRCRLRSHPGSSPGI